MCATMTVQSGEWSSPPSRAAWLGGRPLDRDQHARRERFLEVVREHDRGLRALAFRLLGERDAMDDALQEAYLRAYRNLDGFRGESSLGTWLYRITYNTCIDRLRSARPERSLEAEDLNAHATAAWADDPATTGDRRVDLEAALARLRPEQRAAVLLVDAMGYDYATTADILGVPAGTLASRLHEARSTLRRVLDPESASSTGRKEDR